MNERQMSRHNGRAARAGSRAEERVVVQHRETLPTEPPPLLEATSEPASDPTLFGLPAEVGPPTGETTAADGEPVGDVIEIAEPPLVVLRRPDAAAGSLLLVAGAAGVLSLFLPWVSHQDQLGLTLVQHAISLGWRELDQILATGLALPLGLAAGGLVLFLLGLLAFRPASTHRVTGVLALFVALAVAAGVVVRVADADSNAVLTDPGVLCAVVVAAVGLLGALKAMLTAPAVTTGAG